MFAARLKEAHQLNERMTLLRGSIPLRLLLVLILASIACSTEPPAEPTRLEAEAKSDLFQITPLRPVEELRSEALAAQPPLQNLDLLKRPDLVELSALDDTIQFDIRYASDRNFMGTPFYDRQRAYLQMPVAASLLAAHRELSPKGLGLLVYDAYRPWFVTKMFWEATPANLREFVADPDKGSRHNRGAAVDLTLYDLSSGRPLEMPSGYDEFSERAHPEFDGGSSEARENRALLIATMRRHGFEVYQSEWWHFDFHGWEEYPILNLTFEELDEQAEEDAQPGDWPEE